MSAHILNLVFAVIAVLLAIVGAWSDMLFLPIIVANTCIGIIQEVHSKKVLDKLSILNAPHTVVIRDGKRQEIPADQLVLDDIVGNFRQEARFRRMRKWYPESCR